MAVNENYLKLQKAFSLFDMVINLRDLIKNKNSYTGKYLKEKL